MRKFALRCILAGVLLGTAASRVQISLAVAPDGPSAVDEFLKRQGLAVHAAYTAADDPGAVFSAPGCDRPLMVKTLSVSLEGVPLLELAAAPGDTRHYIYLGEIRPAVEPVAIRVKWITSQVLATLGLAPYRRLRTILFVAEPPGCDAVRRIDWGPFWSKAPASTG